MNEARSVKLFRHGSHQAVDIPLDFELPGDQATMRKEGDRLVIEPKPPSSLLEFLATLEPIEETFPEIADLPAEPFEL